MGTSLSRLSQYNQTASGPTPELALLALVSELKFTGFGAEVVDFYYPRDILPQVCSLFDNLLEEGSDWKLALDLTNLAGRHSSREDVVHATYSRLELFGCGCGPSIHFALIALLSQTLLVTSVDNQSEYPEIVTFLKTVTGRASQQPVRDYIVQMTASTRFGTGTYRVVFETREVAEGLTIYIARLGDIA